MRAFVAVATIIVIGSLAWVYVAPPPSMQVTRDGVPHFAPPVVHPVTGEAIPLENLVRHFKGAGR